MMSQSSHRKSIIFALLFLIALAGMAYFAGQVESGSSPPPGGFLAADKGYGLTINLTQYDEAALADTLDALRRNGLLWLRQPVLWSEIEPAPGQFNWESLDRVFAAVAWHNSRAVQQNNPPPHFKLIAILFTTPAWARPADVTVTAPPTEISDFGNFARAFAERYGGQLDHYQIWHEPNLSDNWGQTYVDPAVYAGLLRDATLNIRQADPEALILSAALAPNLENGRLNLNELTYLDQLYLAKADRWFDIVAGQPYGFDVDASATPSADIFNFRRLELLHQVMLAHGDRETPVWATAFGWNALPTDWSGRSAPWRTDLTHYDPPELQAQRTAAGLEFARQNWPWLGPMLAVRWDSTGLAPDDPAHGFALANTPLLNPLQAAATAPPVASIGQYPADHPSGTYSSGWRTALTLADAPRQPPRQLTISFQGTRLDLTVNRGDYRAYLWVTIDGQPANALPQDGQGRSYLVLSDPLREQATVTLAQNLPPGPHQAVIEAEGSWGQWAIAGWTVSNRSSNPVALAGLVLAGATLIVSGLGLLWQNFPAIARFIPRVWEWVWQKLADFDQAVPGDTIQIAIIFGLAFAFYFTPGRLALVLLLPLILAILYRPDLGLVLIAFSVSFFQAPKQLPIGHYLLTETTLLLSAAGFILRGLKTIFTTSSHLSTTNPQSRRDASQSPIPNLQSLISNPQSLISNPKSKIQNLKSLDWAALTLLLLSLLSTLTAFNFRVSLSEWRLLIVGSVVYYFLVRWGKDYGPALPQGDAPPMRWVWRLVDALAAGAVFHCGVVLWGYFFAGQFVAAEGVRRVLSPVYGSPNNLSLFLDREWPILLAVAALPGPALTPGANLRRWLYGLGLVIVSITLYLTYSNGALLVGLPLSLLTLAVLYGLRRQSHRRRMLGIAVGIVLLIALSFVPLSQTARFQNAFEFTPGTTAYFRLKLWQSSLNMLRDYWPLGVGLDNFLYLYRTRYILPEAWQEANLNHPHNLVLDYATRLGVGGIVILVWLQIAFWLTAWRLYRRWPVPLILGLMGSMAVFLGHGLIDNSYFLVDLAFVFFLTVGLIQGVSDSFKHDPIG